MTEAADLTEATRHPSARAAGGRPAEARALETRAAEARAPETRAAEARAAAGRPAGGRPAESRPAKSRPTEAARRTEADPAHPTGPALPTLRAPRRTIGRRTFDFDRQIAVMAIVNRTPDSFFDQGATFALDRAVEAALAAADDGADWVDIGGVPFRPGPELPVADEIERVVPVVEALAARSDVVISVDTFRPEVAAAAIAAGASVINDTTGIHDHRLADVVADSEATLVVTHALAAPRQPHPHPTYRDIGAEVAEFLRQRVELAIAHGIPEERLVVDPGHDLNKTTRQTLELTRRLGEIAAIGLPTLAAVSNKDFIGETLDRAKDDRLAGSIAAATVSVMLGARIVRMHATRPSVDAMRLVEGVLGWREPAYERHNL